MCHTFFVPDEHRSFTLDMLELIDLMDSRLEGRTRIISIHEARNKFPSLQVPTRLPEGFDLSSVIIDEKRQENDRRAPYLPCSVALKYTSADSPRPWIEIGHPQCSSGGDQGPTADAADWREVTVSGKPATILDVEGRDSVSLFAAENLTCVKVSRDANLHRWSHSRHSGVAGEGERGVLAGLRTRDWREYLAPATPIQRPSPLASAPKTWANLAAAGHQRIDVA